MSGRWLEHVVVRSAVFATVYHWLHGHPWGYPMVVVLLLIVIVRGRASRHRKGRVWH